MLYPRFIQPRIEAALKDTRVVLLGGPRQSGKTTLAKALSGKDREFLSFDNPTVLSAAQSDPVGFVRELDKVVIDEVQRAPEILLAIKGSVDQDRRPGRFLLTGSADLMTAPKVADSLAGRMEHLELLPLGQAELRKRPNPFLREVFAGRVPSKGTTATGEELVERVVAGGYPEALQRATVARRMRWHQDYLNAILSRDVRELGRVDRLHDMPRLLRGVAHHSGQLVNYSELGGQMGLNHVTTQKYVGIFGQLYLLRTLPPWFTNKLSRLVKTPKVHFLDSGLLASLLSLTPTRLKSERHRFGPLLETFVFAEALKLASQQDDPVEFFHFRDNKQNEVDLVIENSEGKVVGIEVKASATATVSDFAGLKKLQEAAGRNFALGLVLYDHDQSVPFGEKLAAAPISTLWS